MNIVLSGKPLGMFVSGNRNAFLLKKNKIVNHNGHYLLSDGSHYITSDVKYYKIKL